MSHLGAIAEEKPLEIRPQPGPQTKFLKTSADIAIYGGAAGGGKTFSLLLKPLLHIGKPGFGSVVFRRTYTQVMDEGGPWDTATQLYLPLGAKMNISDMAFRFASGASVSFSYLDSESDLANKQGSQICLLGFDELTHFSERQFFFMLSRNRSLCGVRPCVRGTVNPDADSWLVTGPDGWGSGFISWWIGDDGLPIAERAGKIRWFIRRDGRLFWADSKEEICKKFGADQIPKSVTFIPAKLTDNRHLMEADPGYMGNLQAMSLLDRSRFLDGNWRTRAAAGLFFKKEWFTTVDLSPASVFTRIRYWDRAATAPEKGKEPDWTVGVLVGMDKDKRVYIEDVVRFQGSPAQNERSILNTAARDGGSVVIGIEQDPGSAGVNDVARMIQVLFAYTVRVFKPTQDKQTRAKPASALTEQGFVSIVRGKWNSVFLDELEAFPEAKNDDQVDAFSGAINGLKEPARGEAVRVGSYESVAGL